jgi:hypothetical protein
MPVLPWSLPPEISDDLGGKDVFLSQEGEVSHSRDRKAFPTSEKVKKRLRGCAKCSGSNADIFRP